MCVVICVAPIVSTIFVFWPPGIANKLHSVNARGGRYSGVQNYENIEGFASIEGNVPDARHEGMLPLLENKKN